MELKRRIYYQDFKPYIIRPVHIIEINIKFIARYLMVNYGGGHRLLVMSGGIDFKT